MRQPLQVAVVGGGWAGMAAAVTATQAGHRVTVFESARTLGGRARSLPVTLPDGSTITLDNGQHILIGAYSQTLALMQTVGVDASNALRRLPLAMQFPDGDGLALRNLPAPLDALWGLLTVRGWSGHDRWSMLRAAAAWQLRGFQCDMHDTVAMLCRPLTPRVMETLIEPLCVSALNTPADRASGQVFLTVLRDSLLGGQGSSNLLLPKVDLSALFPQAAAEWMARNQGDVRLGHRVEVLQCESPNAQGQAAGSAAKQPRWILDDAPFDAVIWATGSAVAAKTLATTAPGCTVPVAAALSAWSETAQALQFEAIATVYAHAPGVCLPQPMLALRANATQPAQFVFDRGHLGGPAGLLAFVVSASSDERDVLQDLVIAQGKSQLAQFLRGAALHPLQTVVEKRATFACTPALQRPAQRAAPGLLVCGDYTEGPYPATLEGAVRSGVSAAQALQALHQRLD